MTVSGKHTPGPWEVQLASDDPAESGLCIIGFRTDGDGVAYATPTNGLVAIAVQLPVEIDEGDYTRCQANARLIAAAPQLLEALKDAFDVLEGMCDDEINEELLPQLRAAIAAATGGAA